MRTLYVNCTRFGDLLQTQPAIAAAAASGEQVGLLCLDNFAPAAQLLHGLHYVQALPGAGLLAALDNDWRLALASCLEVGRRAVREFAPTRIVNLTATLSVRLLARQLALAGEGAGKPDAELVGFALDDHGFGYCSGLWATFLQAATMNRGCSPFNLVDLFCKTARHEHGPWPNELAAPHEAAHQAAHDLLGDTPQGGGGYAALQLGASEDRRRWPVERFAALGRMLRDVLGLMPVLLGSAGERHLAQRYLETGAPGLDCVGKTDLPTLAATLMRCRCLVSNDTGTMHLAAGLGVPVVGVFLATAQPWDTGPYAEGNLCLEPELDCHPCDFGAPCPHNLACRACIPPETVLHAVCARLGSGGAPHSWKGARVWRTALQENGFMGLECLSGHEADDRTQWVRVQRHVYRHFLDQHAWAGFPVKPGLSPEVRQEALDILSGAEQLLQLMLQQALLLRKAPREALKRKFLATWQRVQAHFARSSLFNVLSYVFAAESQEAGREMESVVFFVQRYQELVVAWKNLLQ